MSSRALVGVLIHLHPMASAKLLTTPDDSG